MSKFIVENYHKALDLISKRVDCVIFTFNKPTLGYDVLVTEEQYKQRLKTESNYSQEDFINYQRGQKQFIKFLDDRLNFIKKYSNDILFTQVSNQCGPFRYEYDKLVIGFRYSKEIIELLKTKPSFFSWENTILEQVMFFEKGKSLIIPCPSMDCLLIFDELIYYTTDFKGYTSKLIDIPFTFKYPYKLNDDGNLVLSSKEIRHKYIMKQKNA